MGRSGPAGAPESLRRVSQFTGTGMAPKSRAPAAARRGHTNLLPAPERIRLQADRDGAWIQTRLHDPRSYERRPVASPARRREAAFAPRACLRLEPRGAPFVCNVRSL